MLNTIDDRNFKTKDYIEALKRLEASVLMLKDNFGFTSEKVDFSKLKEEFYSDIKTIRKILKNISSFKNNGQPIKMRNNKRRRFINNKKKLKRLYIKTQHSYPPAVIKKEDKFFVRFYCVDNTKRYYKKFSNKLLRRTSNKFLKNFGTYSINKGNAYKRVFDYYWNLY